MNPWQDWIGREEHRTDRVDPALTARWLATLDRTAAPHGQVPQGLHWCLCTPEASTSEIGPDGHPRRSERIDSLLPPLPLPRRMWASSRLEFHQPLRLGETVSRATRVLSITAKQGGSGDLIFVELEHRTVGEEGLAISEVQSLVYRAAGDPEAPPAPPPLGAERFNPSPWAAHRVLVPDEVLLFRFSALTFNSHRIHYDAPYAQEQENYRGLVVHGPLTATLLLDLARRELGDNRLSQFAFRGVSPAICGEALHLVMRPKAEGHEMAAYADDGRLVMSASAS